MTEGRGRDRRTQPEATGDAGAPPSAQQGREQLPDSLPLSSWWDGTSDDGDHSGLAPRPRRRLLCRTKRFGNPIPSTPLIVCGEAIQVALQQEARWTGS